MSGSFCSYFFSCFLKAMASNLRALKSDGLQPTSHVLLILSFAYSDFAILSSCFSLLARPCSFKAQSRTWDECNLGTMHVGL